MPFNQITLDALTTGLTYSAEFVPWSRASHREWGGG